MTSEEYKKRSLTFRKRTCDKDECVDIAAGEVAKKAIKQVKKKERAKLKRNTMSLSDWKNELQKVVNRIVRKLDENLPCISHPNTKGFLRYDAGHYYSVKSHSDIRFNVHNIHKQNSQSNQLYGGDANYTRGINNRYGSDYLDMMLGLPLKYKGIGKEKYNINDIRYKYFPIAKKILSELENGETFTRDQINEKIGIYT